MSKFIDIRMVMRCINRHLDFEATISCIRGLLDRTKYFRRDIDQYGTVSKCFFYAQVRKALKSYFGEKIAEDYLNTIGDVLFIELCDYEYISMVKWDVSIISYNGGVTYATAKDVPVYLISDTAVFENIFYRNKINNFGDFLNALGKGMNNSRIGNLYKLYTAFNHCNENAVVEFHMDYFI